MASDAASVASAERASLVERVRFVQGDARERLPFDDATFDAVTCIDSINHFYDRQQVLGEWRRVVRPAGRILFTDPITVTGLLRRDEVITRSAGMGEFVFTLRCRRPAGPRAPPVAPGLRGLPATAALCRLPWMTASWLSSAKHDVGRARRPAPR